MLRLWMTASTSDAARTSIHTTQGTVVHTDKLITNAGQTLFACTNLATPLGTYTHAVLRDHDVAQMEWPLTTSELRALLLDDMDNSRMLTEQQRTWFWWRSVQSTRGNH
ncbi:hypothetical protein PC122_g5226 [Phytophthora cactorum]|nr:hypothetical protein PC122_g5226 [Phytophthora cactorum]